MFNKDKYAVYVKIGGENVVVYTVRCRKGLKPYRNCNGRCISCQDGEVISIAPGVYVEKKEGDKLDE